MLIAPFGEETVKVWSGFGSAADADKDAPEQLIADTVAPARNVRREVAAVIQSLLLSV
ncbi:hypothetical protein VHN57_07340 [Sphingobium sp. WW5]|uniref:hypothetical protein n=1 Tax=Sphingobium sp. WW5 TaxID=3111448 RepID=UPI003C24EFDF